MIGKSTIQISRDTKSLLDQIGNKNDTYDDIVKKCIEAYISQTKKKYN